MTVESKTKTIFWQRSIAVVIIVFAFVSVTSAASTIKDYKDRLESAAEDLSELSGITYGEEIQYTKEMIAEIYDHIPATEEIEWNGGSVTTDNKWLRERFSSFENARDISERNLILADVNERLEVLILELGNLEAAAADENSKDADKQKLAEILQRPEYKKAPDAQASLVEQWVKRFMEWLRSIWPDWNISPSAPGDMASFTMVLQIVLYVIVFLIIGFLLYKIAPAVFPHLRRKNRSRKKDRVILGEKISDDASAHDIFDEAEALARSGDIRAAIRKGYIALLCELSDRRIIGLAHNKTNRDYLRDLRKNKDLHNDVSGMTRSYEEHWYGSRTADGTEWETFRTDYRKSADA